MSMQQIQWTAEHVAAFEASSAASPMLLTDNLRMLDGAALLEYRHGRQHALVAVRNMAFPLGNRLDVVGLVSDGDRLEAAPAIEQLRRVALISGFNYMTMLTRRDHVARACQRAGWQRTGVVMVGQVNHV